MSADDQETVSVLLSEAEAFNELYALSAKTRPLLIRCYIGSSHGGQSDRFRSAARRVIRRIPGVIKIEVLTLREVRKSPSFSEQDLAMWLLQSHCHFILTHVHQGTEHFEWPVRVIYSTLFSLLGCHESFPRGLYFTCPVFTRDKFEYLRRLFPESYTLPTLKIPMFSGSMEGLEKCKVEDIVKDFMKRQPTDQDYILKAPFVTNSQHYKYYVSSGNFEGIMTALNSVYFDQHLSKKLRKCYEIPYMMLQCKVPDSTEPKLAFIDGVFSHFCGYRRGTAGGRGVIKSLPNHSQESLIAFAISVIELMRNFDGVHVMLDGLIRVDLFDDGKGNLVNEIEGLEAGYQSSDEVENNRVHTFLDQYWEGQIYNCINNVL